MRGLTLCVVLIGCGLEENRQAEITECCECLASTIENEWEYQPDDYCWRGDTYEQRYDQCNAALDNRQEPYISSECKEQLCGGSCPMLND